MTRLEALEAARKYITECFQEKNARGYPTVRDIPLTERLAEELKVAQFLLGPESEMDAE
jgi:hypothetical protein